MIDTDIDTTMRIRKSSYRSFIICKRGNSFIPVNVADLLFLHHHAGVTFATDKQGNKYIVDKSLSELEELLDNRIFFRVNRKIILSIYSIKEFQTISFGKIAIELKHTDWYRDEIIVSQVNAPLFKKWIHNL